MKWVLLVVVLLHILAFSPALCQSGKPEQKASLSANDTLSLSTLTGINTEMFYGTPHLLVAGNLENGKFESIPFEEEKNDWKIFMLLAGFFSLSFAKFFFSSRSGAFVKATTGNVSFNQMEREGGFFNETLTYLLLFNFLVVFSLLLWQTIEFFQWSPAHPLSHSFLLFAVILMLVVAFFLVKGLFLRFIAWVFDTRLSTTAYLKNMFLFNQLTGLVLIFPVAYLIYNPSSLGLLIVWIVWLLLNLFKLLRGASIGYNVSAFSGYYLILYLCSVELAPLLLIIKVGSNYLSGA